MLPMDESGLSLKEKNTQHWFSYYQIAWEYLKKSMTHLLNITFDEFGV